MSPSFFKRGGASAVKFREARKDEINIYNQMLSSTGFNLIGTPVEFRASLGIDKLRESAKKHANENGCALVVEVRDPNPMANPFNPYKYYLYKYQGGAQQIPEPVQPPSKGGQPPQQQTVNRSLAEFICPYCNNQFTAYIGPGRNTIVCSHCRGQSMVDIPTQEPTSEGQNQGAVSQALSQIQLRSSYNTIEEMVMDCCEVVGKILIIDGNPIEFEDTGEFLYPFLRMKQAAYQHVGFRNMDMMLTKEATHDYKIFGSEVHSQTQANVNPHRDDLFAIKVLGGVNFMVLDEFKRLDDDQKQNIANAFYEFLTRYVRVSR